MSHRIDRHFAQERMEPQTFPRANARQLADTGQGLEAAGMIDFGKAMAGLGKDALNKIIEVRTESQQLEGASQWERSHMEFYKKL